MQLLSLAQKSEVFFEVMEEYWIHQHSLSNEGATLKAISEARKTSPVHFGFSLYGTWRKSVCAVDASADLKAYAQKRLAEVEGRREQVEKEILRVEAQWKKAQKKKKSFLIQRNKERRFLFCLS